MYLAFGPIWGSLVGYFYQYFCCGVLTFMLNVINKFSIELLFVGFPHCRHVDLKMVKKNSISSSKCNSDFK